MYRLAEKFDKKKLPPELVERYRSCGADSLKVALWALCNGNFDADMISADLSIPLEAVEKAVGYWVKAGLFVDLAATASGDTVSPVTVEEIPRLNHIELSELSLRDPNVARIIQESQKIIGRNLTSPETARFLSIYNFYDFEPAVLLMMLEYSRPRSKRPFSYLEKIASEWNSLGVTTVSAAEKHLQLLETRDKHEAEVSEILDLSEPLKLRDKQFIRVWFEDFHYGTDMVREAYAQTGKSSVSYINTVLRS